MSPRRADLIASCRPVREGGTTAPHRRWPRQPPGRCRGNGRTAATADGAPSLGRRQRGLPGAEHAGVHWGGHLVGHAADPPRGSTRGTEGRTTPTRSPGLGQNERSREREVRRTRLPLLGMAGLSCTLGSTASGTWSNSAASQPPAKPKPLRRHGDRPLDLAGAGGTPSQPVGHAPQWLFPLTRSCFAQHRRPAR